MKWRNYDDSWNTWEPADSLDGAFKLIAKYEKEVKKDVPEQERIPNHKESSFKESRNGQHSQEPILTEESRNKVSPHKILNEIIDNDRTQTTEVKKIKDKEITKKNKEENLNKSSSSPSPNKKKAIQVLVQSNKRKIEESEENNSDEKHKKIARMENVESHSTESCINKKDVLQVLTNNRRKRIEDSTVCAINNKIAKQTDESKNVTKETKNMNQNKSKTKEIDTQETKKKHLVNGSSTKTEQLVEEEVYNIEALVKKKGSKYLVKWEDYSEEHNTWEPKAAIPDFILQVNKLFFNFI